ncbi:MAG: V/A-type H+/Na+-transporting ATPase subunit I [Candidatus Argoarchaeum ethanivorans]|uniref:A-type ATP synthase subunit I n=1 Tax=Candidatus Argoarchaeum ethanivorans TaxID=2608793 RepID=A0A8B3S4C3_9EURY|nr:MAG: V/A-type H+/Na+-transporting ATPase subunit I [Candidatus Argoarchaeum ethanivorans]
MLKPEKMTRVVVVGTSDALDQTIENLHKLNLLHIIDYDEEEAGFKIGKPGSMAPKFSEHLVTLRSIENQLGSREEAGFDKKISAKELPSQIESTLSELEEEVLKQHNLMRSIETELKQNQDIEDTIKPLASLPLSLEDYTGYQSINVFVGFIDSNIEDEIKAETSQYELYTGEIEGKKIIAVAVAKEKEDEINKILQNDSTYVEIRPPELTGNPQAVLEEMAAAKAELTEKLANAESELVRLKQEYAEFMLASEEYLTIETQKSEAPLRFATSDHAFVVDGWVPLDKYDDFEKTIEGGAGNVYASKLEDEEVKDVPIALDNPKAVKPFELLVDTFATPKYKEIDPSLILFITFPLFYGIMLGDIGYGVLLGILSWVIMSKVKSGGLHELAIILSYSALSTIFFGIIFGEVFGFPLFNITHHEIVEGGILGIAGPNIWILQLPIHRFAEVKPLLVMTFVIGILHITLGLILGIRNVAVERGFKHAVTEKMCWLMILFGGIMAIVTAMPAILWGSVLNTQDPIFVSGIVLGIIGIILLVKGEGAIAIMEIPTLLSNIFSYARILAIGLSSAGIALAVNTICRDVLFSQGGVFIVVGILVLILGHTINLLLGIIGPGLHSLRLQYVEFFTKFYEGGGTKYDPFGFIRKYTEE